VNLSVKKNENRSTFGEDMDNIVEPCFLTHSVYIYIVLCFIKRWQYICDHNSGKS